MHQEKHLTSVRSDLGVEKTYCTECGRFIDHKPQIPVESEAIPYGYFNPKAVALRQANAAYKKAVTEDETAFRVLAFVAASLVILGIMSKVIQ